MARPELKGRQFTIYANREEDLRKWKELCPPMTLNGWILEMIEKGIENRPPRTNDTQELNDLRKKVQELTKENEMMAARLHQREILDALERSKGPMQLDKQIIDLLKTGGCWPSTRIIANLINHGEMEDRAYPTTALEERVTKNANSKRRKAIKHTLDALESVGLIELTPQGWRLWK
jgi:hypothetical protein